MTQKGFQFQKLIHFGIRPLLILKERSIFLIVSYQFIVDKSVINFNEKKKRKNKPIKKRKKLSNLRKLKKILIKKRKKIKKKLKKNKKKIIIKKKKIILKKSKKKQNLDDFISSYE